MAIKIFIDAGHNPSGPNTGAAGNGLNEADVTFEVSSILARLLNNNPDFTARLSRTTPTEVIGNTNSQSLTERVRLANEWNADYFISIHTNAVSNPQANGTEVLVYSLRAPIYPLAEEVLESITERMNTRDRGVKADPSLFVLRRTKMPAMLIELAFITNPQDARKLKDDPYGFAYAIYEAIVDYFD